MFARFQPIVPDAAVRRLLNSQAETASMVAYLLKPVALLAYSLAVWRLAADLSWMGEFFIAQGLFSHWQVWAALAAAVQFSAAYLDRLGRPAA